MSLSLREIELEAVIDTGATMLVLPQNVIDKLNLRKMREVKVRYANNKTEIKSIYGVVTVEICGRAGEFNVLAEPEGAQPLVGQIILEQLDLIVDPGTRKVFPNPRSPEMPMVEVLKATPPNSGPLLLTKTLTGFAYPQNDIQHNSERVSGESMRQMSNTLNNFSISVPKLVFAIDASMEINKIINIVKEGVLGGADIIEIGTPLIKIHGVKIIDLVHKAYPNIQIYADLKVVDFPEIVIPKFFSAGASLISVMIFATKRNIQKALELAKLYNKKILISTMGYPTSELKTRIEELSRLGVEYIIAHGSGEPNEAFYDMLKKLKIMSTIHNIKLIAAGGINKSNLYKILDYNPEMIIIGRGIIKKDIKIEIKYIKEKMIKYQKDKGGSNYAGKL